MMRHQLYLASLTTKKVLGGTPCPANIGLLMKDGSLDTRPFNYTTALTAVRCTQLQILAGLISAVYVVFAAMQFFRNAKVGEFLWYRFLAPYVNSCQNYTWAELCGSTLNYMFYGPSIYVTPDDFQVILKTWPASVSARNIAHWAQMLTDGKLRLQRYNHGSNCTDRTWFEETCNQQAYGSLLPLEYDLSRITTPQIMLDGQLDIMSVPEDVTEQIRRLTNALVYQKVYPTYSHMDFVWDRNARHAADLVEYTYRFSAGTF